MATIFDETWSGTSGELLSAYGHNWVVDGTAGGVPSLDGSGHLNMGSGVGGSLAHNTTAPVTNCTFATTYTYPDAQSGFGFVWGLTDAGDFVLLDCSYASGFTLYQVSGGSFNAHDAAAFPGGISIGTPCTASLTVSGTSVSLSLNGSVVFTATEGFVATTGYVGFRNGGGGSNARLIGEAVLTTPSSGPPSLSLSPTTATATDGSTTVSITPTLSNSTAALTASVSGGGTISTASPTNGTPFTYTPPSSGSGTATVTVTDATDSLTATCSITYSPAVVASLSISPTTATAIDGSSTVSLTATRTNSSAALTAAVSGGGTISTASPTTGTPFTYTPPSSGSGTATVTVTDATDSLTASCSIAYAPPNPTFTVALAPSTPAVSQGSTITSTVTYVPSGGFNGAVVLALSGLPDGVSGSFSPVTISGGGSSILTLTASSGAALGASPFTVSGTSSSLSASVVGTLTVDVASSGGTYPNPADVRSGVSFGPTSNLTGTLVVPTTVQVLAGVGFGAGSDLVGLLAVPGPSQVLAGVSVGTSTGNVSLPSANEVENGIAFGPSSGTTGTYAGTGGITLEQLETALSSGITNLNLNQSIASAVRALDTVADSSLVLGDALVAAVAIAVGKQTITSTTYTIGTPSTGTAIRTFSLNSATSPTSRS